MCVRTRAVFGQADKSVRRSCDIGFPQLRGHRSENKFSGPKFSFGPDFSLPRAVAAFAAGHDKVLANENRQDILHILQTHYQVRLGVHQASDIGSCYSVTSDQQVLEAVFHVHVVRSVCANEPCLFTGLSAGPVLPEASSGCYICAKEYSEKTHKFLIVTVLDMV